MHFHWWICDSKRQRAKQRLKTDQIGRQQMMMKSGFSCDKIAINNVKYLAEHLNWTKRYFKNKCENAQHNRQSRRSDINWHTTVRCYLNGGASFVVIRRWLSVMLFKRTHVSPLGRNAKWTCSRPMHHGSFSRSQTKFSIHPFELYSLSASRHWERQRAECWMKRA